MKTSAAIGSLAQGNMRAVLALHKIRLQESDNSLNNNFLDGGASQLRALYTIQVVCFEVNIQDAFMIHVRFQKCLPLFVHSH